MNISKIIVAFDASRQSNKAMEWAIDLAEKYQTEVTVVTVVKPPEFSPTISEVEDFTLMPKNIIARFWKNV